MNADNQPGFLLRKLFNVWIDKEVNLLAVTRKVKDKIHINDDIVIYVLDIKSKSVRIGIEAPPNYAIFRGEIYEKILESNKEMVASEFNNDDIKAFLDREGKLKDKTTAKKEDKPWKSTPNDSIPI